MAFSLSSYSRWHSSALPSLPLFVPLPTSLIVPPLFEDVSSVGKKRSIYYGWCLARRYFDLRISICNLFEVVFYCGATIWLVASLLPNTSSLICSWSSERSKLKCVAFLSSSQAFKHLKGHINVHVCHWWDLFTGKYILRIWLPGYKPMYLGKPWLDLLIPFILLCS